MITASLIINKIILPANKILFRRFSFDSGSKDNFRILSTNHLRRSASFYTLNFMPFLGIIKINLLM